MDIKSEATLLIHIYCIIKKPRCLMYTHTFLVSKALLYSSLQQQQNSSIIIIITLFILLIIPSAILLVLTGEQCKDLIPLVFY